MTTKNEWQRKATYLADDYLTQLKRTDSDYIFDANSTYFLDRETGEIDNERGWIARGVNIFSLVHLDRVFPSFIDDLFWKYATEKWGRVTVLEDSYMVIHLIFKCNKDKYEKMFDEFLINECKFYECDGLYFKKSDLNIGI